MPNLICYFQNRKLWIILAGAAVPLVWLAVNHKVHVWAFAPYLLILLCPLMHLFIHKGHGDHGDHSDHDRKKDDSVHH